MKHGIITLVFLSFITSTARASDWFIGDGWTEVIDEGKYLVVFQGTLHSVLYNTNFWEEIEQLKQEYPSISARLNKDENRMELSGIYDLESGEQVYDLSPFYYLVKNSVWISEDYKRFSGIVPSKAPGYAWVYFEDKVQKYQVELLSLHYPSAAQSLTNEYVDRVPPVTIRYVGNQAFYTTEPQVISTWFGNIPVGTQTYIFDLTSGKQIERIDHARPYFLWGFGIVLLMITTGIIFRTCRVRLLN